MRFSIITVILFFALGSYIAEAIELPDQGRFILPKDLGPELLHQCSRSAPTDIESYWQPSSRNIDELEKLLPAFISKQENGFSFLHIYDRQYIGFVKHGKRYIYGNFYPRHAGEEKEASRPMIICDGGSDFWGIVYDISSQMFKEISFNGDKGNK